MRLCFLIAAHNLPEMLCTAFDSIYADGHLYFLHIDKKSTDRHLLDAARALSERPNVFLTPRMSVSWGGFSQIKMEITALKFALEKGNWDYFVFLSGTDLLVRPLRDLELLLEGAQGRSFMDRRRIAELPTSLRERIKRRSKWLHLEFAGRNFKLPLPLRFLGKSPEYYGSQWHFMGRSFCEDVVTSVKSLGIPIGLKCCMIPDEVFWQNILNTSALIGERVIPKNLRHAVFRGAPSPRWITLEDVADIERSGAYFARKFHPIISEFAIEYFLKKNSCLVSQESRESTCL